VSPLLILLVGIVVVVGMIVVLRINAFIALVTAALAVSLLAPGPTDQKVARIAEAFGQTAGSIAIVIGMAAVVGQCMMASGAADRIVRAFLGALGERRAGTALAGSGFVLSIPVFFDTVFYLLVPLARSMFRRTGRNYLKSVMAISAGAAVTHTLVPPTPGPMVIADTLKVDLGVMILVGITVALPAAAVGLAFATWLDRRMPIEMRPLTGTAAEPEQVPDTALPSLGVSLLPIVLPVLLISTHTIVSRLALGAPEGSGILQMRQWTALFGNPNFALMASAAVALLVYIRQRRATREQTATTVETALMSAGVIILITAGGGAFGAMLRAAEIGPAIQDMFAGRAGGPDFPMLFLAFFISSLLKFAQGSSTVAMITAAGMMSAMLDPASLTFHPVYLAIAIGSGSLVGSWMNDSGFWIYAKMGGLLETETLRSWTVLLIILGSTAMAVNVLLAMVMPMAPGPGGAGGPAAPGAQQVPGIERLDPALDELVAPDAAVEILAEGYEWSEGPVWVRDGGFLLFSDIPQNAIYRWKEGEGARLYLRPSGYTGSEARGGESGSNGLTLDREGRLVLAQHGDRRIARMDAPLDDPRPAFTTLADRHDGARFNSPNDLAFHSAGDLYFTDPAYGLPKGWDDPAREMDFAGVFRLARDGAVTLLTREMTRPNGLAFSPDERRLYVAQSDAGAALWRVFDVTADGGIENSRILFDATPMVNTRRGLPDGLKIDTRGNLFATGPGGVLVLTPDGRHLGTILTGQATSNVAFGDDGRSLYITADMYLMRVRLKTQGVEF
jgi:gluconate:H+ symporter, GntP family